MTKEEAIKRIKDWNLDDDDMEVLSTLIPELKESEDERTRKELLSLFEDGRDGRSHRYTGSDCERYIAWLEKQKTTEEALRYLKENHSPSEVSDFQAAMNIAVAKAYNKGYADVIEKQGENKPADEVKPKFKVGDKIIRKELGGDFIHNLHKIFQVDILDKKYRLEGGLVAHFSEEDDWELVEQKPTDKVEPKFKVGDFVVNKFGHTKLITNIENDCYYATNIDDNTEWYGSIEYANIHFYKWTIQDAKDGDVLCSNQIIILFKQWESNTDWTFVIAHAGIDISGELQITDGHWLINNKSKPATKEQRDLLFTKMKEAGYEWDAEKKELKKINIKAEHGKYYYCIRDYFSGGKKFSSKGDVVQALRGLPIMGLEDISEYFLPVDNIQKSAWSEEDEKIGEQLLNWFKGCNWDTIDNGTLKRDDIIAWLEERV